MRTMLIRAAARVLQPVVEEIERQRSGRLAAAEIKIKLKLEGVESVRAELERLGTDMDAAISSRYSLP